MNMASGQTFFPGHEDIDKTHVPSSDGTHCTKCKMDLRGRGDLRISHDDSPEWATLRRKNQLTDRMKKETNQMTQANLLRALKQLYPNGPSSVPSVPAAVAHAEEKLKGHLTVGQDLQAYEMRIQGSAQLLPRAPAQGVSASFDQAAARAGQAQQAREQQMAQDIAQKMGALTPGQRQAARQNAEKALAIALFHTDPRIHAHLLMDAANDDPDTMDQALAHAWRNDLNTWRTQAVERAAKMVAIMDGLGKASL